MTQVFNSASEVGRAHFTLDLKSDFLLANPRPLFFRWMPKASGRTVVWFTSYPPSSEWLNLLDSEKIDANVLLCGFFSPLEENLSKDLSDAEVLEAFLKVISAVCGSQRSIIAADTKHAPLGLAVGSSLPQAVTVLFDPAIGDGAACSSQLSNQRQDVDTPPRVLVIWGSHSSAEEFVEAIPLNIDVHSALLKDEDSIALLDQVDFVGLAVDHPDWDELCTRVDTRPLRTRLLLQPDEKEYPIQTVELDFLNNTYPFKISLTPDTDLVAKDLAVVVDFHEIGNPPSDEFGPSLQWSPGLGRYFHYLSAMPADEQKDILSYSGEAPLQKLSISVLRWDIASSKTCNAKLGLTIFSC